MTRYEELKKRLLAAGGRRLCQARITSEPKPRYLEIWLDPDRHPIVVHDMEEDGVDVYVQATGRNNMDELYRVLGI